METDHSKHTYFRWKIKWRLEHLGALGTMGEAALFIYSKFDIQNKTTAGNTTTQVISLKFFFLWQSMNISNEAKLSKDESDKLQKDALTVEGSVGKLANELSNLKQEVETVKQRIDFTTQDLDQVKLSLTQLDSHADIGE